MLLWWMTTALASDISFLGFSHSGQFAAWRMAHEEDGAWVAEVRTLHVPESAWAHWPVQARGPTRERALARVDAAAKEHLEVQRIATKAEGALLGWWTEVDEDRRGRLPRARTVRVRLDAGQTGLLEIRELPASEACPVTDTVATAWIWTAPGRDAVDLFRIKSPLRVPPCVVRYDLVEVRQGPRGALAFLFRAWVAVAADDVAARYVPASTQWPPPG